MKAIYPGTFDPPTLGHLNIIERGAKLFESLTVAIGVDTEKAPSVFTVEERLTFLKTLTKNFSNVSVIFFEGLLVDAAKECDCILRSVRTFSDYEHEKTLAHTNQKLSDVETLFLFPDEPFQSISSSLIRDIAKRGERLGKFIPESIEKAVFEKLQEGTLSDH